MMENWFITGGCGFIGRNLILRLLKEGQGIRVFDNLSVCGLTELAAIAEIEVVKGECSICKPGVIQLIEGDIRDESVLAAGLKGMDIVVHLAANTGVPKSVADPSMDFSANALGTFLLLEQARRARIKRFIFASSGAPTGNATPPITEDAVARPVSPYGASKLAGEGYCSAYFHCFGLETVALRFSNVYGPFSRHKTSVVAKFVNAALAGEVWTIFGDGRQTRDFLYVADLVDAIWRAAMTPGIGGEIFQISTGVEHTLLELTHALQEVMSLQGVKTGAISFGDIRTGDIARNYADPSKAERMMGWKAVTALPEGLKITIDWFLTQR